MKIAFNRPYLSGREGSLVQQAIESDKHCGDGAFTRQCHAWFQDSLKSPKALLTHSCTAALEMMALLAEVGPGDEVVMPSYTFVSTANAFVLRGATPVFVDVQEHDFNLDAGALESAITEKTKAIVPVHYAGVACDMDSILALAEGHRLWVLEDAAQALGASYKGKPLGTLGHAGAFSFHETKNISCGEGGLLAVCHEPWLLRAEVIREKGTNRSQYFRGMVDKYTWVECGSSYLPSELNAAFLKAQLDALPEIQAKRVAVWDAYHAGFAALEVRGVLRRPVIPDYAVNNGHMYYVVCGSGDERTRLIEHLKREEIQAVFHYVPLHSSPAGKRFGRVAGSMRHTDRAGACLLRLPMHAGLRGAEVERVVEEVLRFYA
jgi:dTDP-4-amino-4,6-dideoxygalactose transaminase